MVVETFVPVGRFPPPPVHVGQQHLLQHRFLCSVWTLVYLPLLLRNKADKSLALLSSHVRGL